MTTLTLEHIPVTDLPAPWRRRLEATGQHVTVTLATENPSPLRPLQERLWGGIDRQDIDSLIQHTREAAF
jgi:hypothetical protein